MPLVSLDGATWEEALTASDACGLISRGPRRMVILDVAKHFSSTHPDVGLMIEGVHFTLRNSNAVCDTCGSELTIPFWRHISDPKTDTETTQDADGIWALCGPCHNFLMTRDHVGWTRECWRLAVEAVAVDGSEIGRDTEQCVRAYIATLTKQLMRNLNDGVEIHTMEVF